MTIRAGNQWCLGLTLVGLVLAALPAHADGTLFGVIHDNTTQAERLVSVNPVTAALTSLGSGVSTCCGVSNASTIDPAGHVFFFVGILSGDATSTPRLFRFNTQTGADLSGGGVVLPVANNYNHIEWDGGTGTLYGLVKPVPSTTEQLVTINPTTGALANVGAAIPLCCGVSSSSSALGNGQFFFVGQLTDGSGSPDGTTRLFSINLGTGAVTSNPVLVQTNSYSHLGFDSDTGTLYAMVRDSVAGAESVASINPATGALGTVGVATASCCSSSGTGAYDASGNIYYFTGGTTADAGAVRLMGFSTASGANVSSPLWPSGNNYNFLEFEPAPPVPPDLAISKSDGVATALAGGSVTYTITASHVAGDPATGATVVDNFPAACSLVSWTCAGAGGGTCTAAGVGNLSDTVNLPAGGSVTYSATCTLAIAASGSLVNTASVVAPAGLTDPVPGNDSSTDSDTILLPPSVSGIKTVSGTYIEGSTVTYVVILTNAGTATQADNPGNELSDTLSADLTLVNATATSGTVATVANTVTWNGAIAGGGTVTITIVASINAGSVGHSVANQGSVAFDSNADGTNDAAAVTDDPSVAGAANPTTFVVAAPSGLEVPTLGPIGLTLLLIALGGVGVALIRQA